MKIFTPKYFLLFLFLSVSGWMAAQVTTVSGKVYDKQNNQPLGYAVVVVKGSTTGTTADVGGNFRLDVDFKGADQVTLEITYLGYDKTSVPVNKTSPSVVVKLAPVGVTFKEAVVTGSRVSESIMESPVDIKKMGIKEIEGSPSGDFYQNMGNMQGIDITTASLGFKAVNMRGFNTTAPVRVVQLIDGMDNQAPGLNFSVGNLIGANDLDLQSVEVVTGAASALYGPNAFQGVVSMKTKSPFDYQGMDVLIKGGTRNLLDGQFRYAKVFGKSQNWAIKLTGGYMKAQDWIAKDDSLNRYGDIETTQNFSSIVAQLPYDTTLTQEERDDFLALNDYMSFNPVTYQGLGNRTIKTPGWMENDLSDNGIYSMKLGGELHWKIKDSLTLSYTGKYGMGSAIYQGTNRYAIRDIRFQQHKLELQGNRLLARLYTTRENAGNSYDVVFTGVNIAKANISDYIGEYLGTYFDVLDSLTNGFDNDANLGQVQTATAMATAAAETQWWAAGSPQFDSTRAIVVKDGRLASGSKFIDRSALYHGDVQYNFTQVKWLDLIAGLSGRYFRPNSEGTIFRDTLVDRNTPGDFVKISNWEFGGFVQGAKRFFNDRFKVIVSLRGDKNQNFKPQFSPRLSLIIAADSAQKHIFRISAQQAFRMPTLQNQFIFLNLGPITLRGNLDGYDNLYTLESVKDFNEHYDSTFQIDPSRLKAIQLAKLRPEQLQTVEVGYRGIWFKDHLYVDATAYLSRYKHFIGEVRVVEPKNGQAGEQSGEDAIITGQYTVYQIPVNASQDVTSYGASLGLTYYFNPKYNVNANYTFASLNTSKLSDDLIPGFNTPKHKINLGVRGTKVVGGLGFGVNWQWVDSYLWQSPFATGRVPSYNVLDGQLSYEFESLQSVLRIGASNILGKNRYEVYGGPRIGTMVYASWQVHLF